ncbi:DUF2779 domain-containing protein [Maribacter sp. ACAM166]|uniref:DUF2779 domain-containing protein n=1 Tax=Maribacter sp. ACAM166 TaxID=2508996 RepID=UPI0010FD3EBA|nr:DUF2779 domain-containing protein [Maribacter sp. ACAM166]TLP71731.1 DUF2779 domain-containing protein [Maribacter sp. ACAM166]
MKPLTKSRFKLGLECPNKLYFTSKKEYANQSLDDSFLQALAKGGFQVEALARLHYPGGIFIDTENYEYDRAKNLTQKQLTKDVVSIYEAAIGHNGLFIRTDIISKKGNHIKLIEVKAKSFDPNDEFLFLGKRGGINSGWKSYLFDLAFQKYVAQNAYPQFTFEAYLLMANKTKTAKVDGLNQLFRIPKDGNPRTDAVTSISSIDEIGDSVLSEVNVDALINGIIANEYPYFDNLSFEESINLFKDSYQNNQYLNWPTQFGSCKGCEFRTTDEQEKEKLKSGFKYCFEKQHNWKPSDFEKPNAFEIWNFRGKNLVEENRLLMDAVTEEDINIKPEAGRLSASERQWIQVEKAQQNDNSIFVLKEELKQEMDTWKFPLHFIDFETSTVALPFTKGRRPYEQVAFQFSHHQLNEDGSIEHKSEYINNTPGEFPNFEFARALRTSLSKDQGTIFRFAAHENTIVNAIISQLQTSSEHDAQELISFLKSISTATKDNVDQWTGNRSMVDLNKVVKDYYYNPLTKGSNSLKAVLPASLHSSPYLQKKYALPIGNINVGSTNFEGNQIWLEKNGDEVINPYKILPPLFDGWSMLDLDETISELEGIADGGAALTAYAKLQYVDMEQNERDEITNALLKYCELDTLSMVIIYEHFRYDIIN